jgi:hypothetical protein
MGMATFGLTNDTARTASSIPMVKLSPIGTSITSTRPSSSCISSVSAVSPVWYMLLPPVVTT